MILNFIIQDHQIGQLKVIINTYKVKINVINVIRINHFKIAIDKFKVITDSSKIKSYKLIIDCYTFVDL